LIPSGTEIVSAWATTRDLFHVGPTHTPGKQISRLGNPLVNELVIGLLDKARFNTYAPFQDVGNGFGVYVTHPTLPAIIDLLFRSTINSLLGGTPLATIAPRVPRTDLVAIFLTGITGLNNPGNSATCEIMRLNTSISPVPAASQISFGVIEGDRAGFPNGRRPGDDVVDIALRVMMGKLNEGNSSLAPLGGIDFTDGAPQSASLDFTSAFPYLKTPNPGAVANSNANICQGTGTGTGTSTATGTSTSTNTGADGGGDGCSVASTLVSFLSFF